MKIITLGSCSSANCSIVSIGAKNFIIDTGKIEPDIIKENIDRLTPAKCEAILITHAHFDHLSKHTFKTSVLLNCPIYIRDETFEVSKRKFAEYINEHPSNLIVSYKTKELIFDNIIVKVIDVPHRGMGSDESGPSVSYFFIDNSKNEEKLFFGTDIGDISDEVQNYINNSEVLFIESNHDVNMVENSPRYHKHKKWLFSCEGHLSNNQTAAAIEKALRERGKPYQKIILSHLSRNCNTPEKAIKTIYDRIKNYSQPLDSIIAAPAEGKLYIEPFRNN